MIAVIEAEVVEMEQVMTKEGTVFPKLWVGDRESFEKVGIAVKKGVTVSVKPGQRVRVLCEVYARGFYVGMQVVGVEVLAERKVG